MPKTFNPFPCAKKNKLCKIGWILAYNSFFRRTVPFMGSQIILKYSESISMFFAMVYFSHGPNVIRAMVMAPPIQAVMDL